MTYLFLLLLNAPVISRKVVDTKSDTMPFVPAGEVSQPCPPELHNLGTCQPEDDNNENAGRLKAQQNSESNFLAIQNAYTITEQTKTKKKKGPGLLDLLESRCQAAIAGSLQQRVPGLARWCPSELSWNQLEPNWSSSEKFETDWSSLEKLETVGSSLKQCETVWSSLKPVWNSLKHSEAVWSQSQCYMAQLRSLTTQGLHFGLLGINLLNLSRRHSRNHTFEPFRGKKQDLQMLASAHSRNLKDKWPSMKNHQVRYDQIIQKL